MTVLESSIRAGAGLPFLFDLLWPASPKFGSQEEDRQSKPLDFRGLLFDHLMIEAPRGRLTAESVEAHSTGSINLSKLPSSVKLRCEANVAHFSAPEGKEAAYWVAPLVNLLIAASEPPASLGGHPLRPIEARSTDNSAIVSDLRRAGITTPSLSNIIRFEANGPAFLVAVGDSEELGARLRATRNGSRITALMVGRAAGQGSGVKEVMEWFPYDLVEWLSVASGAGVRLPWLEFRDVDGVVVSRLHFPHNMPPYDGGRGILDERIHHGLGRMLTLAARSQHFRATPLRVALRAIQGVQHSTVNRDDAMLRLLLALEGLATMLGAHRIAPSTWARPGTDLMAEAVVGEAVSRLGALTAKLRAEEKTDEAEMISRVRQAVRRQYPPQLGAGKAVGVMLVKLGLSDAEAIDPFLRTNPFLGEESLARLLDQCRGRLAHHGFLAEAGEGPSARQAFRFLLYLQDLTLRVVLRIIGYDGLYDPPTLLFHGAENISWVNAKTPPSSLGFD